LEKTNQLYVVLTLAKCYFITTKFDLWMSKGAYNVFALVINFLSNDLQPKHVTINLFEATKILRQTLVKSLTKLLDKYGFKKKLLPMLKMKDLILIQ
jgi:DNA-directed RNA polymerase subunit H (RpoH/RPB5)